MSLRQVTRDAVLTAASEFDALGRNAFLQRYGFGPARDYFLLLNGRQYDSKAIVGAAHGVVAPTHGPLKPADFSGGEASVGRVLERLGFTVEGPARSTAGVADLELSRVYTWDGLLGRVTHHGADRQSCNYCWLRARD